MKGASISTRGENRPMCLVNTTMPGGPRYNNSNPLLLLRPRIPSMVVVAVVLIYLCTLSGGGVYGFSHISSRMYHLSTTTTSSSCQRRNCYYHDGSTTNHYGMFHTNSAAMAQARTTTTKQRPSFSSLMATTTTSTSTSSSSSSSSVINKDEGITSSNKSKPNKSLVYSKTGEPILGQVDVCIVGAGPAGLLSAIMLAQKKLTSGEPRFCHIKVLERLARPPPDPSDNELWSSSVAKFYLIGLGGRGQRALRKFHVWEEYIRQYCVEVVGRRDWTPDSDISNISIEEPGGVERIFTDRPYTTQVLPRDKLVGALYKYICEHYSNQITIEFAKEVSPIDFSYDNNSEEESSSKSAILRVSSCVETEEQAKTPTAAEKQDVTCNVDDTYLLQTKLIIAADGSARTIANAIQQEEEDHMKKRSILQKMVSFLLLKPFRVIRYEDDNRRLYKSIPLTLPKNWRNDLNYSARTKSDLNFDALPADRNGNYCGVLLMRESDPLCQSNTDPNLLKERLDTYMPQFSQLITKEDLLKVAQKAPSALPQFRYVTPRLHYPPSRKEGTFVLLGDCAHTVKPYFGLGANSALEDVSILSDCIDESSTTGEALAKFSQRRALESKHLVEISRNLDRPGLKGVVSFIIPLILDSIFHRLFPKLFAPNAISMLQRQDITFGQGRRRKQLDRLGQLIIIGTSLSCMGWVLQTSMKTVAKLSGRRTSTIFATLVGSITFLLLAKKLSSYVFGNYEPADVLAKTEDKITAGETFIAEYKPHSSTKEKTQQQ